MSKNSYCPFCGSVQEEGQKFCTNCGASFEDQQPAQNTGVKIIGQSSSSSASSSAFSSYYQSSNQQPYTYGTSTSTYSTYQAPTGTYQKNNSNANTALILAIIGFVVGCFIIPLIGFSYLSKAKSANEDRNTIRTAEILLWIQVVLWIVGIVLIIVLNFLPFLFWY